MQKIRNVLSVVTSLFIRYIAAQPRANVHCPYTHICIWNESEILSTQTFFRQQNIRKRVRMSQYCNLYHIKVQKDTHSRL